MRITNKTLTRDIFPLLTQATLKELLEKVPAMPLKKPVLEMTVGEFGEIVEDEDAFVAKLLKQRKALKAFGLLKQYKQEMEALAKFFKLYETKKSQEETAAAKNIIFPNLTQRMLIDCVRWFNLNNTEAAEKIKVSEWLTMWQDEAANMLYQRQYMNIMDAKNKAKRK